MYSYCGVYKISRLYLCTHVYMYVIEGKCVEYSFCTFRTLRRKKKHFIDAAVLVNKIIYKIIERKIYDDQFMAFLRHISFDRFPW